MIQTKTSTTTTASTLRTETTTTVVIPGPGYQLVVHGIMEISATGTGPGVGNAYIEANTDVEGAGSYSAVDNRPFRYDFSTSGQYAQIPLLYALTSLTPGKAYGFRLYGDNFSGDVVLGGGGGVGHRLMVDLRPPV